MKDEIQGIGDSVIQDYAEYGEYVNKFRHVPLLEDGLKPVYRRLILTALEEPVGKKVKTAKLIGDNMSMRHPHGTQGIVNVVAELVRAGIFDPQGSFGSKGMLKWSDYPPAAERYSEVCIKQEWRDMVGKLLPYAPHHENDYGKLDPDYLVVPYPIGLQLGSMGIGVGMAVNLPQFEYKSLIRAGYAALCKKPEPWKLLQANGLEISDEDKETFWNNSKGVITYKFKVNPAYSGGLQGWTITGNPSYVKPRTNKLFKVQSEGGKLVIRDESARDVNKLFIARAKRIKTITDSEVEALVREAAEVPRAFSLYTVYKGQSRPITGGVWIQKTMLNYNRVVKAYKADQIQKIDKDITAYQYFRQVADKILNTKESYEDISKDLSIDLEIVKRIASMNVGTLRTTDPAKKIQSLKEKRKTFETLTTQDLLKEFLK